MGAKVEVIKKLRGGAAQSLGRLSIAARILVVLALCTLAGGLLFWLFNEAVYFYLARSYAEELADAYDLNRGLTNAVLWASFAAIVTFSGCMFSFSKWKRRIGYLGLGALLIGHSLLLGRVDLNFRKNGVAERCYVMTRTAIKVLNRVGIDPETGLECHPLSPQMAEKIELYRSGHRPTQIASSDPKFFDAITGEPIVWYSKNEKGEIELFDLMGFHPKTGEELKPITREVADAWKVQNEKVVRRAAALITDPDKFGFFDPVTGAAKVWYWRADDGSYEFYDGPGFQSRTGDQLKIVTRDVIADWRKQLEAAAAKKRVEEEERQRKISEQAALEAQQAKDAADALQKQQQSGDDCDRLAANPTDAKKVGPGVHFDVLKGQADQAFEACSTAVKLFPDELRYQYQLGRAAYFKDKKQAFDIFMRLVQENYAAAFDNLGSIYLYDRKDVATAIDLFRRGSKLDDADSMVSLEDLIDKGLVSVPDPEATKLALLNRAAELGHEGAQRAYQVELRKTSQDRQSQADQQRALQMFGAFMGAAMRH
jgi:hypothetical protein